MRRAALKWKTINASLVLFPWVRYCITSRDYVKFPFKNTKYQRAVCEREWLNVIRMRIKWEFSLQILSKFFFLLWLKNLLLLKKGTNFIQMFYHFHGTWPDVIRSIKSSFSNELRGFGLIIMPLKNVFFFNHFIPMGDRIGILPFMSIFFPALRW